MINPTRPSTRIAILDDYQGVALQMADWSRLPADVEVLAFPDSLPDEAATVARLRGFQIVVSMRERTRFPSAVLQALPELRIIAATGARQSNIDIPAATRQGIYISTTDSPGRSTSELTWALIFAITRRLPQEDAAMRAGRWQTTLGVDLHGKTLGLVGLGRVGVGVARVAAALGVKLLAWSRHLDQEAADRHGAESVTKTDLFTRSDIVSIHVPLNDSTLGLVGPEEIGMMKPTSYLVNTSRGPIVVESALMSALRSGRIAGAALDVFDQEPLPPGHSLTTLENVVLAPHLGYVTEENYRVFYGQSLDNILAYLETGTPTRLLNLEAAGATPQR
ncbi:MAG: D-2-hydroxyacid dehydrogenase family protein [Chloroflexi bacterium]|nr:D-2-hydroxyacid dehydrogenase family protein [Chloroflexota bacterium]